MIKLNKMKKYWSKILAGVVVLLLSGAVVNVAVWESNYVKAEAKKDRVAPAEVNVGAMSDDHVTEVKPTTDDYHVAPDKPRFLNIEKLGIKNARVIEVGIRQNGELGTPYNIYDVGWWVKSGKPGEGKVLLMDGHNGGPTKTGVFKHLPTLQKGDMVEVERGDGARFKYKVEESFIAPLKEADKHMQKMLESPVAGVESISLITCTGEWNQPMRTYMSRHFLRAILQK